MDLVKFIKKGNEEAFMKVVKVYTPSLRAWLSPRIYGHQDIDDIIQEIFIAAYKSRDSLQNENQFEAWLKGIARNKLKLFYRTQSRRLKLNENFQDFILASIEQQENDVLEIDDFNILQKCILKLPEKLRDLINARHLKKIKVEELAKKHDCSISQISVNLFRARQKLRECLENNR